MSLSDAQAKLDAPFGSWDLDIAKEMVVANSRNLFFSNLQSLWLNTPSGQAKEPYFIKMVETGDVSCSGFDDPNAKDNVQAQLLGMLIREILFMITVGDDCSVQPVGRVFDRGVLCGVVMPSELVLVCPEEILGVHSMMTVSTLPPKENVRDLQVLVERLHEKGILHGDIKPHNLLRRKMDSRLIFCDFATAAFESTNQRPLGFTTQYLSPFRANIAMSDHPLTKADDLYATGITMWHLYTGMIPFEGVDDEYMDAVIASGFQPNLLAVDDKGVRELIESNLEAGNPPLELPDGQTAKSWQVCVEVTVVFADCTQADPTPHTYEAAIHCDGCQDGQCVQKYRVPGLVSSVAKVNCQSCSMAHRKGGLSICLRD